MRRQDLVLGLLAAACGCALAATLIWHEDLTSGVPADTPYGLATWLSRHPADWLTAARLTEVALDTASRDRFTAWHNLYAHAKHLAPHRLNADAAFVRSGLFHWYELSAGDRERVLAAAKILMMDHGVFESLYGPLWELTRDLGTMRRISPRTSFALGRLKETAIRQGLFEDYRQLRAAERGLAQERATALASEGRTAELLRLLPTPLRQNDGPLVELALRSLARHSSSEDRPTVPAEVAAYALRHGVSGIRALAPMVRDESYPAWLRARLALTLGEESEATRIESTEAAPTSAEWIEYYRYRAGLEARRGRSRAADAYLNKATAGGLTRSLLRSAVEVAEALDRPTAALKYRAELRALGPEPVQWSGSCGTNELCHTSSWEGDTEAEPLVVQLSVIQSDEIPPYVEIYADDHLVQGMPVAERAQVTLTLTAGRHRLELQLVNPVGRSGLQRRLRIS